MGCAIIDGEISKASNSIMIKCGLFFQAKPVPFSACMKKKPDYGLCKKSLPASPFHLKRQQSLLNCKGRNEEFRGFSLNEGLFLSDAPMVQWICLYLHTTMFLLLAHRRVSPCYQR
ncbi:hypothetical protein AA313_de0206356 [Arthrobotrys entomopaga]|nr:hypothetical protein AA313_de0206356 [Arthrobotrys entomopaga]